jgi:hypothetical protein
MTMRAHVKLSPAKEPSPQSPGATGLLQRECACGGPSGLAGECESCFGKKGIGLQTKLKISEPGDSYEREADRIANQVMASPAPDAVSSRPLNIQRFSGQSNGHETAPMSIDQALAGPGKPLEPALRSDMEQRFGHDFSRVRVHSGAAAEQSARDVRANAYTVGMDIVFDNGQFVPGSHEGRQLIAHELTHVVQQSGTSAKRGSQSKQLSQSLGRPITHRATVQRAITPEDVNIEMVGRDFELAAAFTVGTTALAKGTVVKILTWVNADPTVMALAPQVNLLGISFLAPMRFPKTLLRPVRPSGSRLDPYTTGLDAQAKAVEKNEADLVGKIGKEKTRLENLLATRREVLNRKLIQETMFNRFDPIIAREVAAANAAHSLTGANALDPDLVKAMIFQESEMGTSGAHLEVPPSHPVKSRFNVGQVIDSSAMALLTMLEREQPALMTTFFLTTLRSDLSTAQNEKAKLEKDAKKARLSAADATRLADLTLLSQGSWETFIWGYKAAGQTVGFLDAVTAFFGSSTPAKNMDYEFWIHMMVLWLFEKKKPSGTWLDAIKAYNGSGKRAQHYREAVERRAAGAEAAATAGTPFTPTR